MWLYESPLILICCSGAAAGLGEIMGLLLNRAAGHMTEERRSGRSLPREFLISLIPAAAFLLILLRYGLTVETLRDMSFVCLLFLLSMVDLKEREIPDGCLLAALIVWAAAAPFLIHSWLEAGGYLLAALIYGAGLLFLSLLLDRVLGQETLGGGDIKLFAVAGLYLGLLPALFALMLSCLLGLALAAICRRRDGAEGGMIPFGPSISLAVWFMLLYGQDLTGWYLSLMGS